MDQCSAASWIDTSTTAPWPVRSRWNSAPRIATADCIAAPMSPTRGPGGAGGAAITRQRLIVDVVRRPLGVRSGRAEAGDRRADQPRVPGDQGLAHRRQVAARSKGGNSRRARRSVRAAHRAPGARRRTRRSSVTLRLLRLSSSKYRLPATRRMPSPPRGSSILITSAPRSARRSVAYAPGSRRVRSRIRTPRRGSCTRAQLAVAVAVREVQHEADGQPDPEALPRRAAATRP